MNVPSIGASFDITGYNSVKCTGDPATDAKNFADANGISVDEAKNILAANFGAPAQKASSVTTTSTDEDAELDTDATLDLTDDSDTGKAGGTLQVASSITTTDNGKTLTVVNNNGETKTTSKSSSSGLTDSQKSTFKTKLEAVEAAIKAQDEAYVAWMNDHSNSTKEQTYWDSVTYSATLTDALIAFINTIDSSLLNSSVADAFTHLKKAVENEDSTYVAWKNDNSNWNSFATAMTARWQNTNNFIRAVRHTKFAGV